MILSFLLSEYFPSWLGQGFDDGGGDEYFTTCSNRRTSKKNVDLVIGTILTQCHQTSSTRLIFTIKINSIKEWCQTNSSPIINIVILESQVPTVRNGISGNAPPWKYLEPTPYHYIKSTRCDNAHLKPRIRKNCNHKHRWEKKITTPYWLKKIPLIYAVHLIQHRTIDTSLTHYIPY